MDTSPININHVQHYKLYKDRINTDNYGEQSCKVADCTPALFCTTCTKNHVQHYKLYKDNYGEQSSNLADRTPALFCTTCTKNHAHDLINDQIYPTNTHMEITLDL
jgi:hypothetical protein